MAFVSSGKISFNCSFSRIIIESFLQFGSIKSESIYFFERSSKNHVGSLLSVSTKYKEWAVSGQQYHLMKTDCCKQM